MQVRQVRVVVFERVVFVLVRMRLRAFAALV